MCCRAPQSRATLSNQTSNSGTKCAHLAIRSVLPAARAPLERMKGPAAVAPAASLIKSRRATICRLRDRPVAVTGELTGRLQGDEVGRHRRVLRLTVR